MLETLKHTLYAGLGATVVTAEKIESALQDLVERGRISSEEARETASKIAEESKKEFKSAQGEVQGLFDEWLRKSPVVLKKDLEDIRKQLGIIEARLATLEEKAPESTPTE